MTSEFQYIITQNTIRCKIDIKKSCKTTRVTILLLSIEDCWRGRCNNCCDYGRHLWECCIDFSVNFYRKLTIIGTCTNFIDFLLFVLLVLMAGNRLRRIGKMLLGGSPTVKSSSVYFVLSFPTGNFYNDLIWPSDFSKCGVLYIYSCFVNDCEWLEHYN